MAQVPEKQSIRAHVHMTGTMFRAARKRMVELNFNPKKGFSPYIQSLIRADLALAKRGL